ncbi:MAG: SelB C-terminal domain-containing protein, partial [Chloroflexota bacterium]
MLVGAGEIDAAMLVVAADDGPRAQTLEHLALLDALGTHPSLGVVTKIDAVERARVAAVIEEVRALLGPAVPVVGASGVTGAGLDDLRTALSKITATHERQARPPSLAIDRIFTVKGRGAVVTGSLRGGPLARGETLRLVPGEREVRVREVQVHGAAVDRVDDGGRVALNLAAIAAEDLHRGQVLTADPEVIATDRLLVAFATASAPADRSRWRLHLGTAATDAAVGRSGRDALPGHGIVRTEEPVAARPGERFVLRRSGGDPVGGVILDVAPPRGISRRRQTMARVAPLATRSPGARLELHGAVARGGSVALAGDVAALAEVVARESVAAGAAPLTAVRVEVARAVRRAVTLRRDEAAAAAVGVVDRLLASGALVRDGDTLRSPGTTPAGPDPDALAAMDRLVAALDLAAPPSLAEAAREAGCAPAGVRTLERAGRIVVLEPDLAYAMSTYQRLAATALAMARRGPLTPAAFRDATGTSRKYVMAILEDLDRRALLRRTPDGHIPGPKAPPS